MRDLQASDFSAHIGTSFRLGDDERSDSKQLVLHSVTEGPAPGIGGREESFSLVFLGPPEEVLPQRTFRMIHPVLGELDIFIVPIGPDPGTDQMRYEAIFS